jgi:hypothetical protein
MAGIQYNKFAINETPYCIWDWDIRKLNLDFLETIDPHYFEHIANIHGQFLEDGEKQYAATALRVAYSHGLESLFALFARWFKHQIALLDGFSSIRIENFLML